MDRGPMMFTSDVSLPKDNKIAKLGDQNTAGQLTKCKRTAMLIMPQES